MKRSALAEAWRVEDPRPRSRDLAARRLERLAYWLDSSIPLPGTRFRVGFDALIGLVPGIGDLVGVALSSYILAEAAGMGVPRTLLVRMGANVALEALVGAVPLFGDLFDAAFKANQRNVRLMAQYLEQPQRVRRRSRLLVAALAIAVVAALVAIGVLVYAVFAWAFTAVF